MLYSVQKTWSSRFYLYLHIGFRHIFLNTTNINCYAYTIPGDSKHSNRQNSILLFKNAFTIYIYTLM